MSLGCSFGMKGTIFVLIQAFSAFLLLLFEEVLKENIGDFLNVEPPDKQK